MHLLLFILLSLKHILQLLLLKFSPSPHFINLEIKHLIGSLRLALDNLQLLAVIGDLRNDIIHLGAQLLNSAPETVTDRLLAIRTATTCSRRSIVLAAASAHATNFRACPGSILMVQLSLLVKLVQIFQGLLLGARFEGIVPLAG